MRTRDSAKVKVIISYEIRTHGRTIVFPVLREASRSTCVVLIGRWLSIRLIYRYCGTNLNLLKLMPAALIESRFNRSKSTAEYKNNFGLRGCISNFTPQTRNARRSQHSSVYCNLHLVLRGNWSYLSRRLLSVVSLKSVWMQILIRRKNCTPLTLI